MQFEQYRNRSPLPDWLGGWDLGGMICEDGFGCAGGGNDTDGGLARFATTVLASSGGAAGGFIG